MSEGVIRRVRRIPGGSALAAVVTPGDLALTLDWTIDFTPGERRLLMIGTPDGDNETLAYTDVAEDDVTLTIEAPGAVLPWEIEDPVVPLDATGTMPEESWLIDVDMGDGEETLPCRPSHALQDKLREDETYVGLRCEVVGDEVTTLYDKSATIEPSAFQFPLFVGHLAVNQSIPNGAGYTIVTDWVPEVLRGGMQYNSAFHAVEVPLSGFYSFQVGSAVAWASNSVGRRAIQPWFSNTQFGAFGGGEFKQDAPSTAVQQTTPVVSPLKQMDAGWRISLQVSQTSGGALDLIGNTDGTASFFCVKYEGPP